MTTPSLDSLPPETLYKINWFLERKDQDALSETCRLLRSVAKSNFAAVNDLKNLEEKMLSLDGERIVPEKLYEAAKKQNAFSDAVKNQADKDIVDKMGEEAQNAALEIDIDISDGRSVAHKFLKSKILAVYKEAQTLQPNNANAPIQRSAISYENTIRLRKDYLLGLYKALYNCPSLKTKYETTFGTTLESFVDLDDPILNDSLTTLFNRIKFLLMKDSFDWLVRNPNPSGPGFVDAFQQKENLTNFDNEGLNRFFEILLNWVKSNSKLIAEEVTFSPNVNILNAITNYLHQSLINKNLPESFIHIWEKEFFQPIFNCIPKDNLFKCLTETDTFGFSPLQKAAITGLDLVRGVTKKPMTKNGNPLFIKFLLEQLDEGRRLEALQVVVDREGTTIFQRILQTTRDLNLIKTILQTVFKNPIDMTNYIKANINAFQLELPRDKHLTDWIDALFREEIDSNFSNMNDADLFVQLQFYLNSRDGRSLLRILNKIPDKSRRTGLILELFKNNWGNSNYFMLNKVINKQDLIRILKLVSDNPSQAKFLQLTDYYLMINNEYATAILRKEIAAGNYQYFEGLVQYASLNHIVEFIDVIPEDILKPIIRDNLSFHHTPDVVKRLLIKLEKDERIQLIKETQFVPKQIGKLDLYKLLYDLDILFDCLSFSNVYKTGNPYSYSIMHCLVNTASKELVKAALDLKESFSYVLKSFEGKNRSQVIALLKTRVNRPSIHPTIYDRLIERYPESKAKLEAMFPGINEDMDPKRKRSDGSDDVDETARSEDDAKNPRKNPGKEE